MPKKVSKRGFRAFAAICVSVQTFAFGVPFAKHYFPNLLYAFPPIGSTQQWIRPMVWIVVGIASLAPWFIKTQKQTRQVAKWAGGTSIACVVCFAVIMTSRLVTVPMPAQGRVFHFVIGWQKSTTAVETFGEHCEKPEARTHAASDECNVAMIQITGPNDETVNTLWSPFSVATVHLLVLASYVLALAGWNAVVGSVAKNDILRTRALASNG